MYTCICLDTFRHVANEYYIVIFYFALVTPLFGELVLAAPPGFRCGEVGRAMLLDFTFCGDELFSAFSTTLGLYGYLGLSFTPTGLGGTSVIYTETVISPSSMLTYFENEFIHFVV